MLLQMDYCYCCLVDKSCPTLMQPMDWRLPGSSVHGISEARMLECVAIYFSKGSFQCKDQTFVSYWQADSLPLSHQGSPPEWHYVVLFNGWVIFHCSTYVFILQIFRLTNCGEKFVFNLRSQYVKSKEPVFGEIDSQTQKQIYGDQRG